MASLKLSLCLGVLLSLALASVDGCGCCGGGFRPPCIGRPPMMFGRPPCGGGLRPPPPPPVRPPFIRPPFIRPPPCGILPPPPPPIRPPFIRPPILSPRPPRIADKEGSIRWETIWIGNARYMQFYYMGRVIKYSFPVNTRISISSLLAKFKIAVNYKVEIKGSEGPISWVAVYVGGTRYIAFTYKGRTIKYHYPIRTLVPISSFLCRFKTAVGYRPGGVVRPPPIIGSDGPISWTTIWIGSVRYIQFTFNGRVIKYVYPVNTSISISSLLAKFKITVGFKTITGSQGPISWTTLWAGTVRYIKFTYNGKSIQYVYPINNSISLGSLLAKFKITVGFKTITGSQGPISWTTIYVGTTRYIKFTYNGKSIQYVYPVNSQISILSLLAKFQVSVNYKPTPTKVGSEGPISWYVLNGKLFFFYKTIVNGKLQIVQQRSYGIKSGSMNEIRFFLSQFKKDINFASISQVTSTSNGAHFTFTSQFENGVGKITLFYKFYQNGQLVASINKQYILKTGSDAEINAIIAKFEAYCKANTHVTVVTTKPITGNIDWKTEYRGGSHYMVAIYTEKQGDKVLRTLKKEYKLEDNSQATIDKHLAQFKVDLKNGNV